MIYLTGDIHGEFNRLTNIIDDGMTKDDYVIVLGDFGYWEDSDKQLGWMEKLKYKKFTTLFIDGNHENFDLLNKLKEKEWHGGKVHIINDSVLHLMRGYVFDIEGLNVFTFGGARSHDIKDGIISTDTDDWKQAYAFAKLQRMQIRVDHISWWKEEMPSNEEMKLGIRNLEAVGNNVDFILTHCCASSTAALMGYKDADACTKYLEQIRQKVKFRKWYFGHYHKNYAVNDKEICLYDGIIRIA